MSATKPNADHINERAITSLRPYAGNARTHSKRQIKQIAASIERFGFVNPVLISDDSEIIAGHGRVQAAKLLGLSSVPTIALSHLTKAERKAYVLADNKLALNAGWDKDTLAIELQDLIDLEFDIELTGFSLAEVDFILDEAKEAAPEGNDPADDAVPAAGGVAVSVQGDVWLLGRHREFAFASGEMSEAQFTQFLVDTLGPASVKMKDGAIWVSCSQRETVSSASSRTWWSGTRPMAVWAPSIAPSTN